MIFVVALFLLFLFCSIISYSVKKYDNLIYPKVTVLDKNLGGFKKEEALDKLYEKKEFLLNKEIEISFEDKVYSATLAQLGVSVDLDKTVDKAYEVGRSDKWYKRHSNFVLNLIYGYSTPTYFGVDSEKLNEYIVANLETGEDAPKSSTIEYKNRIFEITEAQEGLGVDRTLFAAQVYEAITDYDKKNIELNKKVLREPQINEQTAQKTMEKANQILNKTISFVAGEKSWVIDKETMAKLIDFKKAKKTSVNEYNYSSKKENRDGLFFYTYANLSGSEPDVHTGGYEYKIVIDQEAAKDYFATVAPGIEQPSVNAVLGFENEKITIEEKSRPKIILNQEKSIENLEKGIKADQEIIELSVDKEEAQISKNNLEEIGIETLIGLGKSDFSGSPKNRRHNIRVAASKFHGIIIKPGETFSFIETLGPVDASTGYLPELVIKKDKTVPEYGGGTCQVSTTSFRGAVNAGFDIVERRNHAYPVHYYAPQGTDSTVYIPKPDLQFINNTPNNVLVQTKINENELIFQYYGTDDGRKVETLGPFTYDKGGDGSLKAKWTQQVFKADGSLWFEETFLSSYKSPNQYPHPGDEKKEDDD